MRAQLLISRKSVCQYSSFLAHCSAENGMKSIPINNPAITENMECSNIKVHTPVIDLKVVVLLGHSVSLHFVFDYFKHNRYNIPNKK